MLIIPATGTHLATVIFLHGLSHTNVSWSPWVHLLAKDHPNIKWILPQAETGPISLHQGEEGPRWFDCHNLPPSLHEDDMLNALASKQRIQRIIQDEAEGGLPSDRILLAGFSQGSAMALLSGLTFGQTLGGIAVLAGWLPPKLREAVTTSHTAASPPLFWAHGTADVAIPLQFALETMEWLRSTLKVDDKGLTYQEYEGLAHDVNDHVLRDLSSWIANRLR